MPRLAGLMRLRLHHETGQPNPRFFCPWSSFCGALKSEFLWEILMKQITMVVSKERNARRRLPKCERHRATMFGGAQEIMWHLIVYELNWTTAVKKCKQTQHSQIAKTVMFVFKVCLFRICVNSSLRDEDLAIVASTMKGTEFPHSSPFITLKSISEETYRGSFTFCSS